MRTFEDKIYFTQCGIFERYHEHTLSNFPGDEKASAKVADYLLKWEEFVNKGIGLYLWGDVGRGKTSLMNIAFMEIILAKKGITCFSIPFSTFIDMYMESWKEEGAKKQIQQLFNTRLLGIDDLGRAVSSTPNAPPQIHVTILDKLLRYRTQRLLPTWFTSNCDTKEIGTMYSEALRSLMMECIRVVPVKGVDLRVEIQQSVKKTL